MAAEEDEVASDSSGLEDMLENEATLVGDAMATGDIADSSMCDEEEEEEEEEEEMLGMEMGVAMAIIGKKAIRRGLCSAKDPS